MRLLIGGTICCSLHGVVLHVCGIWLAIFPVKQLLLLVCCVKLNPGFQVNMYLMILNHPPVFLLCSDAFLTLQAEVNLLKEKLEISQWNEELLSSAKNEKPLGNATISRNFCRRSSSSPIRSDFILQPHLVPSLQTPHWNDNWEHTAKTQNVTKQFWSTFSWKYSTTLEIRQN